MKSQISATEAYDLILFGPTFWGPFLKNGQKEGHNVVFRYPSFFHVFPMEIGCLSQNINPDSFSTCQIFARIQTYILGAVEIFHINFTLKKKYLNELQN